MNETAGKTLLLVEDEAIVAIIEKKNLEQCGYKVITANTSAKAVKIAMENSGIDLVIMDIDLGEAPDGTETAKIILEKRSLPILFLSSHTEPEIVEKTEKITSYGYVVKDAGITVLDASIKMAFKLFEANRVLSEKNEALHRHSQLLENVIENFPGFVLWKDTDSVFLGCNTNFAKRCGLSSPSEITGKNDYDLPFHKSEIETFLADDREVMRTGLPKLHFEEREHIADDEAIFLDTSKIPLRNEKGEVNGILAVAMDITERKKSEVELKRSEEIFRQLTDNINEVFWISSMDWNNIYYISPGFTRIWGKGTEELYLNPMLWFEQVIDSDKPGITETIQSASSSIDGIITFPDYRIRKRDGSIAWISARAFPIHDRDGKPYRIAGIAEDITARKHSEKVLQEVMNGAGNIHLVYLDRDFNFVRVNKAYAETCGYHPEEMIGLNHFSLYPHQENEEIFRRVRDTGIPFEVKDKPFTFPDQPERGTTYWDWSLNPVKEVDGSVSGLIFSLVETTWRKQNEEALRISEERLRYAHKASNDIIWDWDIINDTQRWNEAGRNILGWTEIVENPVSAHWWVERVHPEDRPRVDEKFFKAVNDNARDLWEDEYRFLKADGSYADIMDRGYIIRDKNGAAIRMIGSMIDITSRKKTEESLTMYRNRLETAQEIAKIGFWHFDIKTMKIEWTSGTKLIFGLDPEDPAPELEEFWNYVHPEDKNFLQKQLELLLKPTAHPEYSYTYRINTKDGAEKHIKHIGKQSIDPDGCISALYGSVLDITEYRNIEDELTRKNEELTAAYEEMETANEELEKANDDLYQSEQRLRENDREQLSTLNSLLVGVVVHAADSRILKCNPTASDILGLTEAQMLGKEVIDPYWIFVHEDLSPMEVEEYPASKVISTGKALNNYLCGIRRGDRQHITWVNVNAIPLFTDMGILEKVIVNFVDITETKNIEAELRIKERRFSQMIENSYDTIVILDADGIQRYVSSSSERIHGYKPRELTDIPVIEEMIHPEDRELTLAAFKKIISEGSGGAQYRHRHKNGGWIYLEGWGTNQLDNPDIRGVVVNVRDITERKNAEDKVQKLLHEKEIILKEVHHRIKNNMNSVSGLLKLQAEVQDSDEIRNILLEAAGRVASMKHLYDRLYMTGSDKSISLKEYIPPLADEIIRLFPLRAGITVRTVIDDIRIDANLASTLGIILNEILTNSLKYAFTGYVRGEITVKITGGDRTMSVIIEDNGTGMPDTVDFDNSPGFGLRLIEMLVEQMEGKVSIERGNGTRFVIELKI